VNCSPEDPPQPLLLPPVEYQRMWDDRNTGAKFGDVTLWRAVPPDGYVVLGHTASIGNRAAATPGVEGFFMCVHKSIAVPGDIFRAPVCCRSSRLAASGEVHAAPGNGDSREIARVALSQRRVLDRPGLGRHVRRQRVAGERQRRGRHGARLLPVHQGLRAATSSQRSVGTEH